MNLFIDTPLESMISSHAIFDNNNIIFLLVFIIMLLSGIILLATISQLLDTEADYQQRKLLKSDKPTIVIDLCYIERSIGTSNRKELFVYDKLDPTGVKMYGLFMNKGYDRSSHNGIQGYAGLIVGRINNAQELPMAVSPLNLSLVEDNGGAVLSNGVGIRKDTVPVRNSSVPETRLLVKKG